MQWTPKDVVRCSVSIQEMLTLGQHSLTSYLQLSRGVPPLGGPVVGELKEHPRAMRAALASVLVAAAEEGALEEVSFKIVFELIVTCFSSSSHSNGPIFSSFLVRSFVRCARKKRNN